MFVKAQSKQCFGDQRQPYVNVDQIVAADVGHDASLINVKLSDGTEMSVMGEDAKKLLVYLQEHELR